MQLSVLLISKFSKMSKIGIVTVLYNSESVLEEFFQTLDQQTEHDFTLYVIDNASKDKSLELSQRLAETVNFPCVFFPEKENWGVAKGNNIGINAALKDNCEYILLANNDIVLLPDTIKDLLNGMNEMRADMAIPKIYFHDTGLIWCAGGKFNWLMGDTANIGERIKDVGQFDENSYTDYAPTCFMLMKRSVIEDVGLMDEKYFVYFDDTDFVYRAVRKLHKKLAYIPKSVLSHKVSSCTGFASDFTTYMLSRNVIYFARKHFSFPHKQLTILTRLIHTYLRARFIFPKNNYEMRKKGHREGFKM